MDKLALALLERGDIPGLLAHTKSLYGDMTMTGPTGEPAGDTLVVPVTPPPAAAPTVTQIDLKDPAVIAAIETARQQEKDKLYSELEKERKAREAIEARIGAFETDLTERQQREAEAVAAAAAAAEEKRLAELSFSEKLTEHQAATAAQLAELQSQIAQRDAVLEKERQFNALMDYRNQALNNTDNPEGPGRARGPEILPELRDLVQGNTTEEIEASVSALADRSASILAQVAAATGQARQTARGVGVTAPPVGPLDNNPDYQSVSAADIAAMDMPTYAANRARLLGAASQQQQGRGMFG